LKLLRDLLNLLYTEPWSLDIVTLDDVRLRYPYTRLGAPALAAIEQSRRILRGRAEYDQIGLGEFHAGLIFLDWEDCRAAAVRFAEARSPWSLAPDIAATCLAYFAQGVALCYASHLEAAMLQFGHVERLLNRPPTGMQARRFGALSEALRPHLKRFQEILREKLWPPDRDFTAGATAGGASPGGREAPPGGTASDTVPPADAPIPPPVTIGLNVVSTLQGVAVPPGAAKQGRRARGAGVHATGRSERLGLVGRPFSQLPGAPESVPFGPIPGHIVADDRYGWYHVSDKRDNFLPFIMAGAWVLAYWQVGERPTDWQEWVIVSSTRENLGSITVRPVPSPDAPIHCYLGYRLADHSESAAPQLILDESHLPVAVTDVDVLAVVQGFWYGQESLTVFSP